MTNLETPAASFPFESKEIAPTVSCIDTSASRSRFKVGGGELFNIFFQYSHSEIQRGATNAVRLQVGTPFAVAKV